MVTETGRCFNEQSDWRCRSLGTELKEMELSFVKVHALTHVADPKTKIIVFSINIKIFTVSNCKLNVLVLMCVSMVTSVWWEQIKERDHLKRSKFKVCLLEHENGRISNN